MHFADLHLHSHYSRAVSQNMTIEELARNAKIKGLDILGTGDFTHPLWLTELKKRLSFENGIYDFDGMKFILQAEIALVYTQGGKGRRIHHILLAPSFDAVDQINEFLDKKGRRDYDGRPIFGFSSIELVEVMQSISQDIEVIPAHSFTPWFGMFGSMSGFDSLSECFGDKAKHIHATETGLSSDPLMNWRLSQLDNITLISNSDSHSPYPHRIGREANAFDLKEVNYENIIDAIRKKKLAFTVEVSPEYGKYHIDGHRNCNFSCSPQESAKLKNLCPRCGTKMTIGVLHRIEELADRPEGFVPKDAVPYKSLIPLSELIAAATGSGVVSKKVAQLYNLLIDRFGSEFSVLLNAERADLLTVVGGPIADVIISNREGKLKIIPGYDGVYGKLVLNEVQQPEQTAAKKKFTTLRDF
ncbi:MAG: DNA helicase UvrD [Candidatus Aenigmarchaeota archaeon]|nr:DNA helicase UvrD [Candidatus Aenigmarchaeota archaeon]